MLTLSSARNVLCSKFIVCDDPQKKTHSILIIKERPISLQLASMIYCSIIKLLRSSSVMNEPLHVYLLTYFITCYVLSTFFVLLWMNYGITCILSVCFFMRKMSVRLMVSNSIMGIRNDFYKKD